MADEVVADMAIYYEDEYDIVWKNSEHSGYRGVALQTATDFTFATSGVCCFDFILYSAFNAGRIDKARLKTIYQGIVAGRYASAAPLHGDNKLWLLQREELGGAGYGSNVTRDWPDEGVLVFFSRPRIGTELDHVALSIGGGEVLSFGESVPAIAEKEKLSQDDLNRNGLPQKVKRMEIAAIKDLIGGLVRVAAPVWSAV